MTGWVYLVICMATWGLATFTMKVAGSRLDPMTALYVAIPVLLGFLTLGEPPTLRKVLGVLLALVSLYLLASSEEAI